MDFQVNTSSEQAVIGSFHRITRDLFDAFSSVINGHAFQMLDVEFYYYCDSHQDTYSQPHQKEIGALRLHRFGMDISLGGDDQKYGGILVRGMEGPMGEYIPKALVGRVVVDCLKLGDNRIEWISSPRVAKGYFCAPRENLGSFEGDPRKAVYSKSLYRFVQKEPSLVQQIKGKEKLIQSSDLNPKEWEQFLGYKFGGIKINREN